MCRAVTGAASHADAARLAALLAATGAETSLVVGDGPLGRGVFTTHAVKESDLLLRVPLQHVLCVTTAGSRDTVEQQLKALRAAVPPEAGGAAGKGGVPRVMEDYLTNRKQSAPARLAAWLLWATRLSPVWRLAGELLPDQDFRVAVATRDAPELHAAYAKAVSSDPSLTVTEAQFAWALSCVASRTFGADAWTRGDRDGVLGLMVPLADLLNHRARPGEGSCWSARADAACCTQDSTRTASSDCARRLACLKSSRASASRLVRLAAALHATWLHGSRVAGGACVLR